MDEIPTRGKGSIPEVSLNDKSSEDKLLDFVNEQIERMRRYTSFGGGIPSFYELNEALSSWSNLNCSFIVLDVLAKDEYQKAKNNYDEFMADKYLEAREILNPINLPAQKWASQRELEYYVQKTWSSEYRPLRDALNAAERKVAFCRRMLDNLESYKFSLGVLSKNIQAESLNLSNARYIEN